MLVPVKNAKKQGRWTLYRSFGGIEKKSYLMIGYYRAAYNSCAVILSKDRVGDFSDDEAEEKGPVVRYEWHVQCDGPQYSSKITFEKEGFLWGRDDEKGTLKAEAMKAAERDYDAAMKKYHNPPAKRGRK